MSRLQVSENELRAVAGPILLLWALGAVTGALFMEPLLAAAPKLGDADAFRPGALVLMETIRLHKGAIKTALGQGALVFLLAQFVGTIVRARLHARVMSAITGSESHHGPLTSVPQFLALHLAQLVLLAALGMAVGFGVSRLPSLEGTLAPSRALPVLLVLAGGFVTMGLLAVAFDVARLALFHPAAHCRRLSSAVRTVRQRARPLLLVRAARWALASLIGVVILHIAARPIGGALGPAVTLVLTQALTLTALGLEGWWLFFAARHLNEHVD